MFFKSKKLFNDELKHCSKLMEIDSVTLHKLQKCYIGFFNEINNICNENNIELILGGGSCLGAVRHKGFIPWDDDIDLNIKRKDVDAFKEIIEKEYSDKYVIQYRNENMICPFMRIKKKDNTIIESPFNLNINNGLTIALFIIEDIPNNIFVRTIFGIVCTIKLFIASCLLFYENRNEEFIGIVKSNLKLKINYYFKKTIGFFFSYESYNNRVIKNDTYFSKYYGKDSLYISIPTGRKHFFGEIYKKELFSNLILTEFEKINCYIPKDYDIYLRKLFGPNYMDIPKENNREHHYVLGIKL